MKKFAITISALLLYCACTTAQLSPIDVTDNTLKVAAFGEEIFYYGFAEGDKVIFNFEEVKGKELKEIEIIELPASSKFMDYKTKKIDNKTIDIVSTGIYKFRFANTGLGGRICKFKIQRIPASEATQHFNCSVYWKTIYDTVQSTVQEKYLIKKEYVPVSLVAPSHFFVNSGSNAAFKGGKSRITIPVLLPKNTVEWYYTFSADRNEETIKQTSKSINLLGQLTKLVDPTNMASIGVTMLNQPPGGDVCNVYLLEANSRNSFEAKLDYRHFPEGTRENITSGVVQIKAALFPQNFIGIINPDRQHGIHVFVEAVAITLQKEWGTRDVVKQAVSSRQEAYLK